jgi:hypothetical protein
LVLGAQVNLFRVRDRRLEEDRPDAFPASTPDTGLKAVLTDVRNYITEYVSLTQSQALVIPLWVAHTWLMDHCACTPYLSVTSKTKRCGKTRLLEVVELLVRNPLRTSSITEAALYHALSKETMTLLMDEVDTIFKGDRSRELLRAVLNASYRRGSPVYRMKGQSVESFDVFSAKMIAGIGVLPDTVADRSIPIQMERGSPVSRFRYAEGLKQADGIKERLKLACKTFQPVQDPVLPDLNDRAQDSWEPLLGIAEAVGLGDETRAAAEELHADA